MTAECFLTHGHSTYLPESIQEFVPSRSVMPVKVVTHFWLRRIGAAPDRDTSAGKFSFENIELEVKDNCKIIGYFLFPSSIVVWKKAVFIIKGEKIPITEKSCYELSSTSSTDVFPFENLHSKPKIMAK
jgi:hypothetical protein